MADFFDNDEYDRWMKHAERTLESAISDSSSGFYSWACFKAQQASEFSVEAYLRGVGMNTSGHAVSLLLQNAGFDKNVINTAMIVDKYYIPTRYADAWSEGIPDDYYNNNDSERAIEAAESIIEEVKLKLKSLKEE